MKGKYHTGPDPDRIILFGSRARGEGSSESDYDLLVIAPSGLPRWKRTVPLYRALSGLGAPKDILWWTPEEAAEWQGVRSHIVTQATREGAVRDMTLLLEILVLGIP